MKIKRRLFELIIITLLGFTFSISLNGTPAATKQKEKANEAKKKAQIQRGEYLVIVGGCHDCHSPKLFTAKGPEPDPERLLSGYPADTKLPEIPQGVLGPDKWGAIASNDLTAWAGPWGVSFARNLTPDLKTGLGSWTEDMFIRAMRTGKSMGVGRDILPPMPWFNYARLSDEDLKAIFAYLKTLKPIENEVPNPIPPSGGTPPPPR